jgi:uncharacterized protein YkwD
MGVRDAGISRRSSRTRSTARRGLLVLAVLLGCLALNAPASAASTGCAGGDVAATTPDALVRAVFCEVNATRATHGLGRLRRNGRLARAALRHARDMLRRRYFAHLSPEGTGVLTRIRRAGYGADGEAIFAGELLGLGFAGGPWPLTPIGLVRMWLASPSHRRVLVARRYRELGIGTVFFPWGPIQAFVLVADFGRHGPARARVAALDPALRPSL